MPGTFIDVRVHPKAAENPEIAKKIVEVCPVDIFTLVGDVLGLVEENLDECTLCDLCIQAAPEGSVEVIKLYD